MNDLLAPWKRLPELVRIVSSAFNEVLTPPSGRRLFLVMISLAAAWHMYVPVHELLHVLACRLCGGSVEVLALKPRYGAHLLAKIFPFVVPESDYAGQLKGFKVPGAGAHAFVSLFPYLLSLFGVTLLDIARRRRSAPVFAAGIILACAPVFGLTGDFYEAGSLLANQFAIRLDSAFPPGLVVGDDLFALVRDLHQANRLSLPVVALVVLAQAVSLWLVLVTLALQVRFRRQAMEP